MQLGVVADDVTGANDIGSMFAKQGWLTHVYSFQPEINGFDLVDAERA
ncbi:MAG: four-carbon acid sugar kinase family protein, partial [Chloroflexota bacterium]|nr:four-carbon acid sugar kinase family protein [Chloroflexota bacterium]